MGDNDFPTVMANGGNWKNARDLANQWQSRSSGSSSFMQSGTGIPTSGEHVEYEAGEGSIEDPWYTETKEIFQIVGFQSVKLYIKRKVQKGR